MGKDVYFNLKMENRFGKIKRVDYHGYLLGSVLCWKYKTNRKYHALVLVTGGVGDGKSTLIEGLTGLGQHINDKKLTFDNVSWNTESMIKKMDQEDNIDETLWWDEAIQGAGGRNMAMSAIGNKLKSSFVTKRFKRHVYYLALDRLQEFAPMLIEMADAWIHVENFALERGRFKFFMNKAKIEYAYDLFKYQKKTWKSKEVKLIKPDCKGNFMNYQGIFLDPIEYNERKMQETRQLNSQLIVDGDMIKAYKLFLELGNKAEVARQMNRPATTVKEWIYKFEQAVSAS